MERSWIPTPLFPEYDFHSIVSGCFRTFSPAHVPDKFKLKGEKKVWRETEIDGKIRQMARRNLLNWMRLRRVRKGEQKMGTYMETLAKHAKSASREAAKLGTDEKNRGLLAVAEELIAQQELILEENKKDLSENTDF